MAKMTLLEMTQNILSSMNSDEVNSISDTVESAQVAEEIRNTFYDLFTNKDLPELESLINLEWIGDTNYPHVMVLPDNVDRIKWIKYLNQRFDQPTYNRVEYLDPEEFIQRVVEPGPSNYATYEEVPLTATSPIQFTIATNQSPTHYTILNGNNLVFNSFDALYEAHLTGSNSLAWGFLNATFELTDDYIPPIDGHLFPQFLAEAKSVCFINIKEVANSKEEQKSRRQLVRSQYRTNVTNEQRKGALNGIDYSRKR
jgi:hypothetical protein